jgi:membrane associated rhomboid family serine protease
MWFVKVLEFAGGTSYSNLGILPRTFRGSIGIITGPLIHGDFMHLFSNTLPFLVLGILLFYFYNKIALQIFAWIYLATGFWIWILARNAYHIGASGVVYGMASFLFFSGIFKRNNQLMAISGAIIILYGGMLYGIFPDFVESNVSWEAHLIGGISGTVLAFLYRKTKIDIEENNTIEEDEEDGDDQNYWRQSSLSDEVHITYSYKPKDKRS